MKRFNCDFSSRFRILKGGKISLVVSALLGSAIIASAAPTDGVVTSGTATISQTGNTTNINQSSQKASINWQNFNIASNETVNFNQPNVNSITLNRVVGNEKSIINGALNANGQVWILNSNGILFNSTAKVNTSGLVATTAELSDKDFQDGNYNFKNSKSNSVVNLGTIEVANNGYVVLASNEVRNSGTIKAIKGKVYLSGNSEYTINLNGNSIVNLIVTKGVLDAMVENSGTIIANGGEIYLTTNAVNELLKGVVNNTGIIEANSLDDVTGKVEVFAHGGTANVSGEIKAEGGFVETSGKDVKIADDFKVTTKSTNGKKDGKWLIDPYDFVVASSGGSITGAALSTALASNDVTIQTGADYPNSDNYSCNGATCLAGSVGTGNIIIKDAILWDAATTLTLNAWENIYVRADITAKNAAGKVSLLYGQTNTTGISILDGVTPFSYYFQGGKINLQNGSNFSTKLGSAGTQKDYTVINSIASLQSLGNSSSNYALGSDLDNNNAVFTPILPFSGTFDGLGHTINKININDNTGEIGLFKTIAANGIVSNLGLTNVTISTTTGYKIGALAGVLATGTLVDNVYATGTITRINDGSGTIGGLVANMSSGSKITNSYAQVTIDAPSNALGGLVGQLDGGTILNSFATGSILKGKSGLGGLVGEFASGTVTNSYATGNVSNNASGYSNAGGFVGNMVSGTITDSYATGNVTSLDNYVGGFAGLVNNGASITRAYALGNVTGNSIVGGFVGRVYTSGSVSNSYSSGSVTGIANTYGFAGYNNGTITDCVWDQTSSGKVSGSNNGTGVTGFTTSAFAQSSYSGLYSSNFSSYFPYYWMIIEGSTRPILASEFNANMYDNGTFKDIRSVHELQFNLSQTGWLASNYSYRLGANLDFGTATDMAKFWNTDKYFRPIGSIGKTPPAVDQFAGIFDGDGHTISNLKIISTSYVGTGLFAKTASTSIISDLGLININFDGAGTGSVFGAIAGYNYGKILNSYVSGGTITNASTIGGLVGTSGNTGILKYSYADGVTLSGTSYVGGLIASAGQSTDTGISIIEQSWANTTIIGTTADGNYGGLVGMNQSTPIINSYARGSITTSAVGDTTSRVGGLVGSFGLALNQSTTNARIENSYSATTITSSSTVKGSLIGLNITLKSDNIAASIINSFWDSTLASGLSAIGSVVYHKNLGGGNYSDITNTYTSTNVSGKTTAEMKTQSTFDNVTNNWNFTDIWGVTSSLNNGYPVLRAFYKPADFVPDTPLSYTLSNIASGYTYTGSSIALSSAWNASSIFGSTYASWIAGTDYKFIYNAGDVTGFTDAGTYSGITVGILKSGYVVSSTGNTTGSFTITPKALTITASNQTETYGNIATLGNSAYTSSGLVSGQNIGNITLSSSGSAATANAGTYSIVASNAANNGAFKLSNYDITYADGTLTKSKRAITLRANDITSKTYDGVANSGGNGFALSSGSFVNGDTLGTSFDTTGMTYTGTSQGAINAGTYTVNVSGVTSTNYNPTFINGSYVISPKALTVSGTTVNNKIYDGDELTTLNNVGTLNGFIGTEGDNISVKLTLDGFGTDIRFANANVGTGKDVTVTWRLQGTGYENYSLAQTILTGAADITKRAITLTADSATKVYGNSEATLGVTESTTQGLGLASSDYLSDVTGTLTRQSGENVGSYDIALGTGTKAGNYDITFVTDNNAYTITKKDINILGLSGVNKTYDGTTTATLSGTASLDSSSIVSGDSSYVSVDLSGLVGNFVNANAGNAKAINVSGITITGAKAGNYNVGAVTGLTANIAKANATVTANSDLTKVYNGLSQSVSGFTASGLVNNETTSVLSGVIGATASGTNAGTYNTHLAGSDTNYNLTFVDGSLVIAKANATVTANSDLTKVYNGLSQSVSGFTATGLVNNETTSVLSGVTGATASGTNAGTYNTHLAGTDTNYNLTFVDGSLVIAKANATVTANSDLTKVYNGLSQSVSGFTATGLVNNETTSVLTGVTGTTTSGTNAGTYNTHLAGSDTNYNLTFVDGSLVIAKKALTITGTTASDKTYDGNTNADVNLGTLSGFVTGETVSATAVGTFASKDAGIRTATFVYTLADGTNGLANNYSLANTTDDAEITKKALTIATTTTNDKVYDGNTNADVNLGTLSGFVTGETVTTTAVGTFASKDVGNRTATFVYTLADGINGLANNYSLANTTDDAEITKKALTIATTTTNDKVYDGNTNADVNLGTLSGFVGSERVTTSAVGTFNSKDVGTRTATFVYTLADGTNGGIASNYSLSNTTDDAEITKKALTIATTTTNDKVYDGNTNADVNLGTLSGFVGSERVTTSAVGTFNSKDVGTRTATFVYTLADGTNGGIASNYSLSNTTDDAQISRKSITVSGLAIGSKIYDGTNSATVSNEGSINKVSTDDVSFSTIATFNNKNVEANKTVNLDYTLSGNDAGNYSLLDVTNVVTSALINAKILTVSGLTIGSKIYDGTNSATVSNAGSVNKITGDDLNFNTVATFNNADVESAKTVNLNYTLSGTEASNYILTNLTDVPTNAFINSKSTTAQVIIPKTSEVTGVPVKLDGILTNELVSQGAKIIVLDASNNDVTELAKQGKIQPGKYSVKAINDNTNYALSSNAVELTINPALDPITVVKTQVSAPVIPVTTAPVVTVNTPATQNTQISNNLSVKLGIVDSGNVNLVSQTTVGQANQVVTLSELKTSSQDNANEKKEIKLDDVRVSLNQNSIVQLVNGGVNLPIGVDQQFYVVRQDINTNSSNGTTNQNSETKDNKKNKGTN